MGPRWKQGHCAPCPGRPSLAAKQHPIAPPKKNSTCTVVYLCIKTEPLTDIVCLYCYWWNKYLIWFDLTYITHCFATCACDIQNLHPATNFYLQCAVFVCSVSQICTLNCSLSSLHVVSTITCCWQLLFALYHFYTQCDTFLRDMPHLHKLYNICVLHLHAVGNICKERAAFVRNVTNAVGHICISCATIAGSVTQFYAVYHTCMQCVIYSIVLQNPLLRPLDSILFHFLFTLQNISVASARYIFIECISSLVKKPLIKKWSYLKSYYSMFIPLFHVYE